MNWYMAVLKKYAEFNGRARRTEYWMFTLINIVIAVGLSFIGQMILGESGGILGGIYNLAMLIPSIAVGIRRMHDTDHSGWFILVPLVNLYFACVEGTRGPNRFGPDPKAGG